MRFAAVAATAALLFTSLVPMPAEAEDERWIQVPETVPPRLIEIGTWQFAATKKGADGKPECFESWTFNADGSGLIVSGQQRVPSRWKYEAFEDLGYFVFFEYLSSSEGPDCMGRAVDTSRYPRKDAGFQLIFMDQGKRALVCDGGTMMNHADGTRSHLLDAEDCWGTIEAVAGQ